MKETDVLYSICDYLAYKKHFFWRNNVIPVYSVKNKAFIRMPKYSRTGLPDIIVINDGFAIGLEVKNEKGRQSDNQKQIEKEWKEAGGEYYVVRSIDDVKIVGL
jgi:hypothetical protein